MYLPASSRGVIRAVKRDVANGQLRTLHPQGRGGRCQAAVTPRRSATQKIQTPKSKSRHPKFDVSQHPKDPDTLKIQTPKFVFAHQTSRHPNLHLPASTLFSNPDTQSSTSRHRVGVVSETVWLAVAKGQRRTFYPRVEGDSVKQLSHLDDPRSEERVGNGA